METQPRISRQYVLMEMADYFSVFLVILTDTSLRTALEDHGYGLPDQLEAYSLRRHYSNRHIKPKFPLRARPKSPSYQAQGPETKGKEKRCWTTEEIRCPLYWRNAWMPFVGAGPE